MANISGVIFAYSTKLTSEALDVSVSVLPKGAIVDALLGGTKYVVIGDGVTAIKDLPRFAAGQVIQWGNITGSLSSQLDLVDALAGKLAVAQGVSNANKILVTDAGGNVVLAVNNYALSADLQAHIDDTANPHEVTAGQVGAYTKAETDSAIAAGAQSLYNTDPDWEAADLAALESWLVGDGTAYDPINSRNIGNFDIYLALDTQTNYYFDSGAWVPAGPSLADYYTKEQADAKFVAKDDLDDLVEEYIDDNVTPATIGALAANLGSGAASKALITDSSGNITTGQVGGAEI